MYFPGIADIFEMQRVAHENYELAKQHADLQVRVRQQQEQQRRTAEAEADVQDAEWRDVSALETPR